MSNDNRKTILYLHGFASGANSLAVKILKKETAQTHTIVAFDLSHDPHKSLEKIKNYLQHNSVDLIVATSLGVYYALCLDVNIPKLLFNPAFKPQELLRQFIGWNNYFVERENPQEKGFYFNESDLEPYESLHPVYATSQDTIILSSLDTVINRSLEQNADILAYLLYDKHVHLKTTNLCGHSMSAEFIKTELLNEIRKMDL